MAAPPKVEPRSAAVRLYGEHRRVETELRSRLVGVFNG